MEIITNSRESVEIARDTHVATSEETTPAGAVGTETAIASPALAVTPVNPQVEAGVPQMRIVQTAGREQLGEFAPNFAHYNDDVLFGENWNDPGLTTKTRCLLTVVTLLASGVTDSSLTNHLTNAKRHGVSQQEIAAAITHVGFYAGWSRAWAGMRQAQQIWQVSEAGTPESLEDYAASIMFPIGELNTAYAQFFVGQSYLAPLSTQQVQLFNVTFAPGCRNHWHIHHATSGGGQILICVGGRGYYQAEGEEPRMLFPGDVVNIPAGVKHWHGAAPQSWFSHLALAVPGADERTEWLEAVDATFYAQLA